MKKRAQKYPGYGGVFLYDEIPQTNPNRFMIVLTVGNNDQLKDGHWVVLDCRDPRRNFYFDPFGEVPDRMRERYPANAVDHSADYRLSEFLQSQGKPWERNSHDYQAKHGSIETCGQYCLLYARFPNLKTEPWTTLKSSPMGVPDAIVDALDEYL